MKFMTLALGSCILFLASTGHATQGQRISRVSVGTGGTQGSLASWSPAISGDGRFVAFQSDAPDLVPIDQNHAGDVFVRDRVSRTTTLVSVAASGAQGNGESDAPSISGEGSFVAFMSHASNLVAGDLNGVADIFVRDLVNGTTERVSVDSSGQEANGLSAGPYVSTAGRYVSFISYATNLVPGDTNGQIDVFVRNQITGVVARASVDSQGVEGNQGGEDASLSYDGRYVAFKSTADNLVPHDVNGVQDVFVRDMLRGVTVCLSANALGRLGNDHSSYAVISADGRNVAFYSAASNLVPGDTNGDLDVFVSSYAMP